MKPPSAPARVIMRRGAQGAPPPWTTENRCPAPPGDGRCSSRSAWRCSATTTSTTRSGRSPTRCSGMLGFTDTQIGTLNAIYSFPNIVMVLVGGIIVDRFGTRLSTLVVRGHLHAGRRGHGHVAALSGDGRRAAHLRPRRRVDDRRDHRGHRPVVRRPPARLCVRREPEHRARRFVQRRHVARRGSSRSTTRAGSRRCGWPPASWASRVVGVRRRTTSSSARAARRFDLQQPAPPDRIVWSDLWRFDRSYWYIVGLCVTFYSVIFPVPQHVRDQVLPARARPVAAGGRRDERATCSWPRSSRRRRSA